MVFCYKAVKIFISLILVLMTTTIFATTTQPLTAEQAFKVQAQRLNSHKILLKFEIAPGYYLYRDALRISANPKDKIILGQWHLPLGELKHDDFLGDYQALAKKIEIKVPIQHATTNFNLHVSYQGCAAAGFCYPPMQQTFVFKAANLMPILPDHSLKTLQTTSTKNVFSILKESILNVEGGNFSFEKLFNQLGLPVLLLIFFCFGILLAFTPCVLPTVPIIAAIVVGQQQPITMRRSFLLCLTFIISMAIMYAAAGWIAGTLGAYWQAELQKPWIIISSILLILIFSAYLFGLFNFVFLSRWQNVVHRLHLPSRQGTYIGAALLGFISTLLISPCVTPPLIGVIGFIANKGNSYLGFIALLLLGLGMGTPLLIAGTFGAHYLQRLHNASTHIKDFFGWLLLILAVFLAERLLPEFLANLLFAIYFLCAAVALRAFTYVMLSWRSTIRHSLGITCFMLSLWFSYESFTLWPNHHPLGHTMLLTANEIEAHDSKVKVVTQLQQLQPIFRAAQLKNKPILLDFYADWCVACQHMEHEVFKNAKIQQFLNNVVFVRVDVTTHNDASQALLKQYNVVAPPTLIYLLPNGKEVKDKRIVGEINEEDFLELLQQNKI